MSDLNVHLQSISRFMLFFLSLCLLTWALFPAVRPFVAGMTLGVLAAWINAWMLFRKVRKIADNAAERGKRRTRFGFFTRATVMLSAALVALKVPEVDIFGVLAGYFAAHLATLVMGFIGLQRGKG